MTDKIVGSRFVLVQGPAPYDAQFLGRWLLAAHELEQISIQVCEESGELIVVPDSDLGFDPGSFTFAAMLFARGFMENLGHFIIPIEAGHIKHFALMAELGLFRLSGNSYCMEVPEVFNRSVVHSAIKRLFDADDEVGDNQVERSLVTLDCVVVEKAMQALDALSWQDQKSLLSVSGMAN